MKTCDLYIGILSFLSCALAVPALGQGWQWQNPLPQGNTIHSVDATDENHIWCGTSAGVIMHSDNGGQTWQLQQTPSDAWIYAIDMFDSLHGWAVGTEEEKDDTYAVILRTTDGGATWQLQFRKKNSGMHTVEFRNRETGWATGAQGLVLFSDDAGQTWQDVSDHEDLERRSINSISIIDSTWIWMAGNYFLTHTEDGGQTWINDTSDVAFNVFSKVQFVDRSHGWIVEKFASDNLYRTTDGGQTWTLSNGIISDRIRDVYFLTADSGLALAQSGVYQTHEGGESWQLVSLQTLGEKFLFVDDRNGYGWENFFQLYKTTDGGESWRELVASVAERNTLLAIDFVDEQTGWVVGDRGVILATSDGGKGWVRQGKVVDFRLTDVQFLNHNLGWASGFKRNILRTTDGGITWRQIDTHVPDRPNRSICFVDSLNGWLVGGDVLEPGWIRHSDNSGLTWMDQTPGLIPQLMDLFFLDTRRGWVVGADGYIGYTDNGGQTWQIQMSHVTGRLRKVSFTDSKTGWVIYEDGHVLFTKDGGQHWQQMFVGGFKGGLWDMTFTDEQHGWISGGIGVLFATQDGGLTWREQFTGSKNALLAIDFVSPQQGWTAGDLGTILMTSSGGVTSVEDNVVDVTDHRFELQGNYPNPFNPLTNIIYRVLRPANLRLTVYNVRGRAIRTLFDDEHHLPGSHLLEWDGRDENGIAVASGVYFYRLQDGRLSRSGKMLLLR